MCLSGLMIASLHPGTEAEKKLAINDINPPASGRSLGDKAMAVPVTRPRDDIFN